MTSSSRPRRTTPAMTFLSTVSHFKSNAMPTAAPAVEALEAHFSRYADTPVFINSDVQPAVEASDASWVERVYYVDGYDHESVKTLMDDSLEAGADLVDLGGPLFAAVFAGVVEVSTAGIGAASLCAICP